MNALTTPRFPTLAFVCEAEEPQNCPGPTGESSVNLGARALLGTLVHKTSTEHSHSLTGVTQGQR